MGVDDVIERNKAKLRKAFEETTYYPAFYQAIISLRIFDNSILPPNERNTESELSETFAELERDRRGIRDEANRARPHPLNPERLADCDHNAIENQIRKEVDTQNTHLVDFCVDVIQKYDSFYAKEIMRGLTGVRESELGARFFTEAVGAPVPVLSVTTRDKRAYDLLRRLTEDFPKATRLDEARDKVVEIAKSLWSTSPTDGDMKERRGNVAVFYNNTGAIGDFFCYVCAGLDNLESAPDLSYQLYEELIRTIAFPREGEKARTFLGLVTHRRQECLEPLKYAYHFAAKALAKLGNFEGLAYPREEAIEFLRGEFPNMDEFGSYLEEVCDELLAGRSKLHLIPAVVGRGEDPYLQELSFVQQYIAAGRNLRSLTRKNPGIIEAYDSDEIEKILRRNALKVRLGVSDTSEIIRELSRHGFFERDEIYRNSEEKETVLEVLNDTNLGPDRIYTYEHEVSADSKNPTYKVELVLPTGEKIPIFVKLYDSEKGRATFENERDISAEYASRLSQYGIKVPTFAGSIETSGNIVGLIERMPGENLDELTINRNLILDAAHERCSFDREVQDRLEYLAKADNDKHNDLRETFPELAERLAIIHHEGKTMDSTASRLAEVREEPVEATVGRLRDYFERIYYGRLSRLGFDPNSITLSTSRTLRQVTDDVMELVYLEIVKAMKADPVYFKHAHLNNWIENDLSTVLVKPPEHKKRMTPIDFEEGVACPQLDVLYLFKTGVVVEEGPKKTIWEDRYFGPYDFGYIQKIASDYRAKRIELGDEVQEEGDFQRALQFGSLLMNHLFIGSQIRDYLQCESRKRPKYRSLIFKHVREIHEATNRIAKDYATPENASLFGEWYEAKDALEAGLRAHFKGRTRDVVVMGFERGS